MNKRQSGATAVEFALVFPLLFMLFYSVVVYAYLFVLQESISFAAQEAAAAAHRVDPVVAADFDQSVEDLVCPRLKQALAWMTENQQEDLGVNVCGRTALGDDQGGTYIQISASHVVTITSRLQVGNLFPKLSMPLIGTLPPMPDVLIGSGSALVGES
ncbi:MAG: TadE/TadG family type IV pilus assembly protein [Oceanococcus sp.]